MKIVRPTYSFWSRNMAKLPDTTCYHPNLLSTDIYLSEKAYEALSPEWYQIMKIWSTGYPMDYISKQAFPEDETPGGGTQVQRGAAPALRILRMKGSFLKTSACPRFCKRKVLFCTQVRSMGVKIPYNPRNIRGPDAE